MSLRDLKGGWLALLMALLGALSVGCDDRAGNYLETVARHQAEVDAALDAGDLDQAEAALEAMLATPAPAALDHADARHLRQDALFQLAALATRGGRAFEAARYASDGLSLGRSDDVFTANLLVVRGHALEQLGEPDGAAEAYADALTIHERLLESQLESMERER